MRRSPRFLTVVGAVLNPKSATSRLLFSSTNAPPAGSYGRDWAGGAGAPLLRPPEPAPQQRRDGWRHERAHHQRVEQQTQTDRGAYLPDVRRSLTTIDAIVNANTRPAFVTSFPVPPSHE